MDLTSVSTIKSLLREYGLSPNKHLGQNFLISKKALGQFIQATNINGEDTIVEAGAGFGTLTVELAKRAKKVIAVEKDRALIQILENASQNYENIEVVNADILQIFNFQFSSARGGSAAAKIFKHGGPKYKLVGNIPYYLTSHLLRVFLESENPPQSMTLIVQKEVAQRICAKPPDMSLLAVSVQFYAEPEIAVYIPRSSFWPEPDVDSAILRISNLESRIWSDATKRSFLKIVKAGFSSPRKQLINNLSTGLKISREQTVKLLKGAGIEPARRAETLSVEEWVKITDNQGEITNNQDTITKQSPITNY